MSRGQIMTSEPVATLKRFRGEAGPYATQRMGTADVPTLNGAFPLRRSAMLALLFEAASPTSCGGREVLRPLWAEEAMHRAANLLHFVLLLEQQTWSGPESRMTVQLEYALAKGLAASFRALDIVHEDAMLPCTDVLRAVVSFVVSLFGPTVGEVALRSDLIRLTLPAYKRRALVLAANELVSNALKHAFRGRARGQISVTLGRVGTDSMCLVVEDNGPGMALERPSASAAIVGGLAGLLEADLVYRRSALGGTAAEFQFPIGETV
jgi:two-component sensor histidine kinase